MNKHSMGILTIGLRSHGNGSTAAGVLHADVITAIQFLGTLPTGRAASSKCG